MASPIHLVVTDEQSQLRDTVRKLLADNSPAHSATDRDGRFDPSVWQQLVDLGVPALVVPEEYGGLGLGPVESWILFEDFGRALYDGPALSTIAMATAAIVESGDAAACADFLPLIANGEKLIALAATEADRSWDDARHPRTTAIAAEAESRWLVTGAKMYIVDGSTADVLIVTAAHNGSASLFAIDATDRGVRRRPMIGLDLTRHLAEVVLDAVPARLIGELGSAGQVVDRVRDHVRIAAAAESVGGMRACLEMCVEHAKTRNQFGVPIGSFQAVAHRCVDILQRAEFGGAATQYAAAASAQALDDASLAASVAAAYCGPAYRWVTAETIHLHGGLGFTWEHDAHLYFRRSRSIEQLFGPTRSHLEAVATRAGL